MEIGLFGSPGAGLFVVAVVLGVLGTFFLALGSIGAIFWKSLDEKALGGVLCLVALVLLVASMTLSPIAKGRQNVGECFDRLPAATFAVDGAFQLDKEVLYIVVQGKNNNGKVVRECAILPMDTVEDYPSHQIKPGEYWIVVEDHAVSIVKDHAVAGKKWTTNTFVPAPAAPVPAK